MPTETIERVRRDLTVRSFEVRANSWDEKTQSFDAVLATEAPVLVMDMNRWEIVEEILVARGCKLPKTRQIPLLDSHNRFSVRDGQVGSVRDLRVEAARVVGRNFISSSEPNIATKVREGHVTDCSVGYRVIYGEVLEPGETRTINGTPYTASPKRALRVSTEWELKENSLCPIGADQDAKIREDAGGSPARKQEDVKMPESTPAAPGAPASPPAAPAPAPASAPAPKPDDPKPEEPKPESRELAEEIRARTIRALAPRDMADDADRLVAEGKTVDQARAFFLERFTKGKDKPVGSTEPAPAGDPAAGKPGFADVKTDDFVRAFRG